MSKSICVNLREVIVMKKVFLVLLAVFMGVVFQASNARSVSGEQNNLVNGAGYAGMQLAHHGNSAQHKTQNKTASVPANIGNQGTKTIIFDPSRLTWAAYSAQGSLVKSGNASGGKDYCPDIGRSCRTPVGAYTIYTKKGAGCVSSKYPIGKGGAPMPYCMFFKGGFAIHGSDHVPGFNASHGCIRVHPDDARWLNQQFIDVGSTKVVVKSY
jgi:lipoprotein-anchoring transpeptidase ErfK/SrfK